MFTVIFFFALSAGKPPRQASREELLEQASSWIFDFDEDDDQQLSKAELVPLIPSMMESSGTPSLGAALTPQMLMDQTDGDKNGRASRAELVDLLIRMKGFDGGHLGRSEATQPNAGGDSDWEKPHLERMRTKEKRRKKKRTATVKDEP